MRVSLFFINRLIEQGDTSLSLFFPPSFCFSFWMFYFIQFFLSFSPVSPFPSPPSWSCFSLHPSVASLLRPRSSNRFSLHFLPNPLFLFFIGSSHSSYTSFPSRNHRPGDGEADPLSPSPGAVLFFFFFFAILFNFLASGGNPFIT